MTNNDMKLVFKLVELDDLTFAAKTAATNLGVNDPTGEKAKVFISNESHIIRRIKNLLTEIASLGCTKEDFELANEKANSAIKNIKWSIDLHLGR